MDDVLCVADGDVYVFQDGEIRGIPAGLCLCAIYMVFILFTYVVHSTLYILRNIMY